ncbi:hypothetical protein KPSA3_03150 [Pseudomonas syringae pv. actinidiae]|uniref:Uncharacterized protein n=1 Tax=Pseudomonas syringae pv. actinidiae TaxID=103796 RepID=A0AAN4Q4G6_PSESF|nr:hypothetical protein KPSA3_03150 [Pseudomonas syringae pv. actinidiae]
MTCQSGDLPTRFNQLTGGVSGKDIRTRRHFLPCPVICRGCVS